jgi:hypothetical protein
MSERIGNYSEMETKELWDTWADKITVDRPELAEELVKEMVEGEESGTE